MHAARRLFIGNYLSIVGGILAANARVRSYALDDRIEAAEGGYVYHMLNRVNARMTILEVDSDYKSFEKVLTLAVERAKTQQAVPLATPLGATERCAG